MEEAQESILLKSNLTLQLQLAEEEKKKIVEEYKKNNYDSFKQQFLEINNKILSLTEQIKSLPM